jgi:hypothetical protein
MSAQLQQAIINAHNAGDVAAAQRLGQMLKKERQASQVAPQAANPSGVAPHRRNQATQPKAKDGAFEGYGDAFMRGIDQPLENMGVTAEALGAKGLGESLKGAVDERPGQSASGQFMNADKDGTFAYRYLPKAAVEQAGQFAGSLLARAGGAAVGGAVGNVPGAIAGGLAGPMMFEFAQQLGPIALERAKNNGRETPNKEDWTYATGTSAGVGALNAIAPGATGKIKRMFIEGVTEGTQSVGEQVGSTVKTDKGLEVDPRQALAEGIIGGTSAGMVDTSISTAKAATNLVRGTNRNSKAKSEDVSEEEMQAKASFAQTLASIAEEENLDLTNIDRTSTKGARQAVDLAHKRLVGDLKARIKDLKPLLAVTDQDSLKELEDKIFANLAQDEARTKVKNKVGSREKQAFVKLAGNTYEGAKALNLMLQLDELTDIHSEGYKGGVSRVTDQLAPLGLGGEGYDVSRANAEQVFRPLLSTAAAAQTGGLSLIPQAVIFGGGRLIDKARGGRSRVQAYVDANQGNPGQTLPSESTSLRSQNIAAQEAVAAQEEEARLRQEQMAQEDREASLESAQKNDPANPESPQGIFELGTALDRNGIAQILRIMKRNPSTLPATLRMIDAYETSVATGGQVDFALIRKINGFVDSNSVYKGLMGNRARNQGVVDQASQQQLSQKEQNYQRGIDNNRAEAARITEAVNQDKTIEVQHKAHLLSTLEEMQLDLGLNPVGRLQTMQKRLEEKGVPGPTVEKYLGQYLQRVMAQQGAKEERDAAQDDAMEIDESREPLVSLADKSQAALDAWNKNSGDSSLRKAYLKARRERDDAGEFGEELTTEYRMQHQAPVSEDDASMHDLEKAMPDFYKRSGDYRTGSKLDWATLDILRRVKDDPEQQVKVYRAVPINASNTINYGDWVTVNKQYAEDHGEGMPEGFKVIEGAAAAKDLKTNGDSIHEFGYAARQGKIVPIYHSTNEDFEEFDTKKSADGTIWFSDNLSLVEGGYDGASGNALVVTRYIDESKLALASRSQEDKLMHQQLQSMGYDGVKYADSKDNVYQIYDPSKLQSNEVNLSVVPGPGALTQPESPQIPFDFTAPSVGQIKDKLEDAKGAVQMVIGKPGTKFENGLSSMEDFKQLADMLNVSVGIFNSQKEFMEKYSVTKGTRGLYGSNKGGVSGQIAILANGIESDLLYTTAHESAHPLESRPASNEEAELLFGRKVSGRHPKSENVKRNVYANSLRAKLRGKYGSDPVIQAEIDKLQDGTVIFIANRPDLPGRPARLNLGQTYEMFRDENPQGSKGQALLDAQNSFPAYQGYMKGDGEFAVDPVMFYLINPKAMKKDMPNTFKFMQKHFNESNIPIKIYASPLATIMAILMAGIIGGEEEEEENPGILTPEPGMLTA